jgi:hypothetical protein
MGDRQYVRARVASLKKMRDLTFFTAVLLNIPAFWNVRSHPFVTVTDASEGLAASIFKVRQI